MFPAAFLLFSNPPDHKCSKKKDGCQRDDGCSRSEIGIIRNEQPADGGRQRNDDGGRDHQGVAVRQLQRGRAGDDQQSGHQDDADDLDADDHGKGQDCQQKMIQKCYGHPADKSDFPVKGNEKQFFKQQEC